MKKKVILLGRGDLSIRIANWFLNNEHFELVNVVPVVPEPLWMDSLIEWCKKNKISYVPSGDYTDIENVSKSDWRVDLVFSCFYDKIVKQWFIEKCEKILNLHHAPLPRYRGMLPINWALKNKEKKHGVTIHEITPGIDDGPIVSQIQYSIYEDFDEAEDVYKRATEYAWTLFQQTIPILDKINSIPQDNSLSTYYSKEDSKRLGDRLSYNRKINKKSSD
jgi:methionyl-tRNA formyltransferase